MKWKSLASLKNVPLSHGAIVRTPGEWPHEKVVDLLVFDAQQYGSGMGLMVDSGYKSGLVLVILPADSNFGKGGALSSDWLRKNWRKWVYRSNPSSVMVCTRGRPKPRMPNVSR